MLRRLQQLDEADLLQKPFMDVGGVEKRFHVFAQAIRQLYPDIKRHYEWFRKTQRGAIREYDRQARSRTEAYRWRGRSENHVLTSGMDDYPRAKLPHDGELHVDLLSWMATFAQSMRSMAEFLNLPEDAEDYAKQYEGMLHNLEGH